MAILILADLNDAFANLGREGRKSREGREGGRRFLSGYRVGSSMPFFQINAGYAGSRSSVRRESNEANREFKIYRCS